MKINTQKKKEEIQEEVKKVFSEFLKSKDYRKTQARYDVLYEIYDRDDHFDVETLYLTLKNKRYLISRATVYNSIDLLLECGLIVRHKFDNSISLYEKSYGSKVHDHLICSKCGSVIEFTNSKIEPLKEEIGRDYNFKVTHHAVNLYGVCEKCS